ncbi:MAG TPA: cyclic-di-AMP receptor [Erysipelotrichaceae bacterium]|nr:cyclic-di-AMP receptor [Erysipelotrichaceae bacterium]
MKLIIAIVSNDDSSAVSARLTEHGFMVTRLSTTGGFLRAGNTTMLIGTEDERVEQAIELIKEESKKRTEIIPATTSFDIGQYAAYPVEVHVGGATIFVLDVDQFIKA